MKKAHNCKDTMSKSSNDGFLFKSGLFALIAGVLYYLFGGMGSSTPSVPTTDTEPIEDSTADVPHTTNEVYYIPSGGGDLVEHTYFSLGYNEAHEQADWVAYQITRERLNANWAPRPNNFRADPKVLTESAAYNDYRGSGFDRGHLCAAADMAFSEQAIDETFYMSNISPQNHLFNIGIWRELEELTRDWARKYEALYVVTGPILKDVGLAHVNDTDISVPKRFYRVLYAEGRSIGFVLPNEVSDKEVMYYAKSVDEVERITGIDFFPKLLSGNKESLEAAYRPSDWPINKGRFMQRVEVWNQVGRE